MYATRSNKAITKAGTAETSNEAVMETLSNLVLSLAALRTPSVIPIGDEMTKLYNAICKVALKADTNRGFSNVERIWLGLSE
jgi:hypothetical protein